MLIQSQIRECINPACRLRYPLTEGHPFGTRCPLCLGETRLVLTRNLSQEPLPEISRRSERRVAGFLDNIRSAWNVGAIFRTADGLGVESLALCGITATPDNHSVRKTSLGAEQNVKWSAWRNSLEAADALREQGFALWALEQTDFSVPIAPLDAIPDKVALVLGNEISGVDPALLDICDCALEIPMRGRKRSLNVEVAFGIAAFALLAARKS